MRNRRNTFPWNRVKTTRQAGTRSAWFFNFYLFFFLHHKNVNKETTRHLCWCLCQQSIRHNWRCTDFFKKFHDWILGTERIRNRILRCFTKQINLTSLIMVCQRNWKWRTMIPEILDWSVWKRNAKSDSFGSKNPIVDFLKETHPR